VARLAYGLSLLTSPAPAADNYPNGDCAMEQLGIGQIQELHEVGRISGRTPGGSTRERREREPARQPPPERASAAAELAVALATPGRAELEARPEVDAAGELRVRIIDRRRGETVAVVTPAELAALAQQTGLPPGLLMQRSS